MLEFKPMAKMARLSREIFLTEKIDGSNASVHIVPSYTPEGANDAAGSVTTVDDHIIFAGSRTRWITPGKSTDNFGFAQWVLQHASELVKLGPGTHFGEWWGAGIQRRYGLKEKRFSLFNVQRWAAPDMVETLPACCSVVPVLYRGIFSVGEVDYCLTRLKEHGSYAAPGFSDPEGIVVFHVAAGIGFKKTIKDDESPKSQVS